MFPDLDNDGIVGFADFLRLAANYGKSDASWTDGDLNHDKKSPRSAFPWFGRPPGDGLPPARVSRCLKLGVNIILLFLAFQEKIGSIAVLVAQARVRFATSHHWQAMKFHPFITAT